MLKDTPYNNFLIHFILHLGFVFITVMSWAQEVPKSGINSIISTVNSFNNHRAVEKLYLHTDKSSYMAGDTIWFKGYLFNTALTNALVNSGLLYIELANDSNYVVQRMMVSVHRGLTFGQIALDKALPRGGYSLRAYTNWMRNFGEDYVFAKYFYISDATTNDWLVKYHTSVLKETGKDNLQLKLKLNRLDQAPIGLRELQLQLTDGKRTWFKSTGATNADGLLEINFTLPEKSNAKYLTLNLHDLRKGEGNRTVEVPVSLNRPEYIDLQFMPEGGSLVAGLAAHIAFKAVSEDGKGVDVTGKIYNSRDQEVADFKSAHKGIGAFNLLAQSGETYSAKISLPDGSFKSYGLPAVQPAGITLNITNTFQSDSCEVIINATPDIAASNSIYYLIGQARGAVCYGASFNFTRGTVRLMISKKTFPTGIVRFTLTGPDKTALNERIIYIDHADHLEMELTTNKSIYKLRDSVMLNIEVYDKDANSVQGSFSLAVTDDGQVRTDSLKDETIISKMLFTGNLRGTVEDSGYYIDSTTDPDKHRHLDQLLLAQGWVGYDWQDVFKSLKPLAYEKEQGFLIKGRVLNMFNKPVSGSGVTLISKRPMLVRDTIANEKGEFTFKGLTLSDTTVFFLQSKNKHDKSFNTGIEMDQFKPPVFSAPAQRMQRWYVNIDTTRLAQVNRRLEIKQAQELKLTGGRVLKEVVITAKKIIKDSKNLNGSGEADIIIDEELIKKAGKKTLGDLLKENIQTFVPSSVKGSRTYKIKGLFAQLIIDGVIIWDVIPQGTTLFDHFKYYLDYYDAEDIKGIEVMLSGKYQPRYSNRYLSPKAKYWEHAFIEVTTRNGRGPFLTKSPGTYLYKPISFILPRKFYTPKYTSDSTADETDIRSTIHWEPNVITNKDGRATITFYTADHPGTYSLILEGTDMRGNLGVKRANLRVEK